MATSTDVRKQIESGKTHPLYLVEGGDMQSRNDLAQEFVAIVDEGLQAFNVEILYAGDASSAAARDQLVNTLLSTARTLPMMTPRRLILVHDAERLLSPKRADKDEEAPPAPASSGKRKRGTTPIEELESYFEAPDPTTTVVFIAGPLDTNRRLVKLVRQHAIAVDSGSLASTADAARWIRKQLERDELTIDDATIGLLLKATGLDLGSIRSEIDKLVLYAAGEPVITAAHVRDIVVTQDEPGENFPMGKALQNADVRLALREIAAQLDGGAQPPMILGQIRAASHWLRPAAIKHALDAIFRTDLAIKSSAGDPRHLLERLVIELCARQ